MRLNLQLASQTDMDFSPRESYAPASEQWVVIEWVGNEEGVATLCGCRTWAYEYAEQRLSELSKTNDKSAISINILSFSDFKKRHPEYAD